MSIKNITGVGVPVHASGTPGGLQVEPEGFSSTTFYITVNTITN